MVWDKVIRPDVELLESQDGSLADKERGEQTVADR
jgi:hypothetical protein